MFRFYIEHHFTALATSLAFFIISVTWTGAIVMVHAQEASTSYIGIQPGWVIDDSGNVLVDETTVNRISQTGSKWVRINFRLGPYPQDTPEFYQKYDQVIDLLTSRGFNVLGLFSNESWPAPNGQASWTENNWETQGGDGYNSYIDQYGYAFARVAKHFEGRIYYWEIWNEPNSWAYLNPDTNQPEGGSYIYPSNFAAMLTHVHSQVHYYNNINVQIISGGLLGHDLNGYDEVGAGSDYLDKTYEAGILHTGKFAWAMQTYGSYPLDGVGQHIYINQGDYLDTYWFNKYLDFTKQVVNKWEGDNSKALWVTEFGWETATIPDYMQSENLTRAFSTLSKRSDVAAGFWYKLDDSYAENSSWGIFNPDATPKQALVALQNLLLF